MMASREGPPHDSTGGQRELLFPCIRGGKGRRELPDPSDSRAENLKLWLQCR